MGTHRLCRLSLFTLTASALVVLHGSASANDLVPKEVAYIQSWDKRQVTKVSLRKKLMGKGGEWVITGEVYLVKGGTYKVVGGFTKGYATWHRGTVSRNCYFDQTIIRGEAGKTVRFTLRFREPPLSAQLDVKLFTPEAKPITRG
jgi:hypothetical protein